MSDWADEKARELTLRDPAKSYKAEAVAAALREAEERGAQRERWECFRIACIRPMECGGEEGNRRDESNWSDRAKHHRHYDCLEALSIADDISDRGPARLLVTRRSRRR